MTYDLDNQQLALLAYRVYAYHLIAHFEAEAGTYDTLIDEARPSAKIHLYSIY